MANVDFIESYFKAEKLESLVFFAVGVMTLITILLLLWKSSNGFFKGLAIPICLIAIVQIVVGSTVFLRSDSQIERYSKLYIDSTSQFKKEELDRMIPVMKNFKIYKSIEVAFIVIGTGIIVFVPGLNFISGIGIGMLCEGTFMIVADVFAEERGELYLGNIQKL